MSKVKIEELENIVLEGGGAKGAAYAGAIKGLEEVLQIEYATNDGDCVSDAKSLLDYGTGSDEGFEPQIKRFAGSSAGAITSFASALGLNSDQIIEVSNFPFKNFLQETHPGKYRMVSSDGEITIGSDGRKLLCLDEDAKDYVFKLDKRQKVNDSLVKKVFRKKMLGWIFSALFLGIWEKIRPFFEMISGNASNGGPLILAGLPIDPQSTLGYILTVTANAITGGATGNAPQNPPISSIVNPTASQGVGQDKTYFEKLLLAKLPGWGIKLLFGKITKTSGMNIGWDAVGNLMWDRGMFSGFAVREFFFDMIVFASVNNTHFHRKYFTPAERTLLKQVEMKMDSGRLKADFSALPIGLHVKLEKLGKMTFSEFYEKTGISLTLCVSNFSTGEPVYFSEYWTPDFPVLEAVGASMSIPPAMKPVYNAQDVFKSNVDYSSVYELKASDVGKRAGKKGDYFDWAQYELDVVAVKTWLSHKFKANIDANTDLSVSSFMPLLRIALEKYKDFQGFSDYVDVEGESVKVTYGLLAYHFNGAYKGLLLDGGYRCNIPYNVFRTTVVGVDGDLGHIDPVLKQTLAIKLDNTYPREWMNAIYRPMSVLGDLNSRFLTFEKKKRKSIGQLLKISLPGIVNTVQSKGNKDFLDTDDLKTFNAECYERIAADILALQKRISNKNGLPWNAKKAIFGTAFEGYAYGSENGQVRFLSDHQHIIPLYSYGLGTYDFDLEKIRGLVNLSQHKSKDRVKSYFGAKT